MSVSIYTFKTEQELADKLTQHPVQGVDNGDIAVVTGGAKADDNIAYKATIKTSPITNLPDSIGSTDGRVQWDSVGRGFGTSGMPTGTEVLIHPTTTIPSGFTLNTRNTQFVTGMCGGVSSGWFCSLFKNGEELWVVDGNYIGLIELDNKNLTTPYELPDLPDRAPGQIAEHARCYCAQDNTIRFVGGYTVAQTYHHYFDCTTKTFYSEGKSPAPEPVDLGQMYDNSANDGKLYVFNNNTHILVYDVTQNSWTTRITKPNDGVFVAKVMTDPANAGSVLVYFDNDDLYRYNISGDSWTPVNSMSYGYFPYYGYFYNEPTGEIMYITGKDLHIFDPELETWSTVDTWLDDWSWWNADIAPLHSSGYCAVVSSDVYNIIQLFAYEKNFLITRD